MILTDKARIDFENWFNNYLQEHHSKEWLYYDLYLDEVYLPDTIICTLIIEWFDSVGYFIEITKDRYITEQWVNNVEIFPLYKTRQEATSQAIIKCNEIYNKSLDKRK